MVFRAQNTTPFQKSSRWWPSIFKVVGLECGIMSYQLALASAAVLGVHSKVHWNAASVPLWKGGVPSGRVITWGTEWHCCRKE